MSGNPLPNNAVFTLEEILSCCQNNDCCQARLLTSANKDILQRPLRGIYTDSRNITEGAIFVALTGEKFDGHQFLQQAANAGAAAAIVEKDIDPNSIPKNLALLRVKSTLETLGQLSHCHREKFSLKIIGITGSYGKTTTRSFIAAALGASIKVLSTQENYNNEIGVPQTLLQIDASYQAAVIEMGMRGSGQIDYLAKLARPEIGVITNIGPQHIELLGSVENVAAAKAELLENLPANGAAILPADDAQFDFLQSRTNASIISFGANANATYRVLKSTFDAQGNTVCEINTPQHGVLEVFLPLPGIHNAINAAAALALADYCGVDMHRAIAALQTVEIPGARMQIYRGSNNIIIDDCYNAGPFSMRAALDVLEQFPAGERRVAVLGSMLELGQSSEEEHRAIGTQAGGIAQLIIGVGEETKVLLEAAQQSGNSQTLWFADAATAAAAIPAHLHASDIILIKGSRSIGLEKVVQVLHG